MGQLLLKNIRSGKKDALITQAYDITIKELQKETGPIRRAMISNFKKIVANWKLDVNFQGRVYIKKEYIAVNVYPTGAGKEIWGYVDKGTSAHEISAVNAPTLSFQKNYDPKTLAKPARVVTSGNAGRSSGEWVTPVTVTQSIEARGFTLAISNDYKPYFSRRIEAAFKRASRRVNTR